MKLKALILLLLIFSNSVFSQPKVFCSAVQVESNKNGKVENNVFTCNRFDWKITIPDNCLQMDMEMSQRVRDLGPEAMKEMELSGRKLKRNPNYLIGFGLDNVNTFNATMEPIDKSQPTDLALHKTFTLRQYNKSFLDNESHILESSSSLIRIGKYDFYRIYGRIYNAKTNELEMIQEIYNCFIGNNLFSVTINYDDEKTGKELVANFKSSLNN